MAAGETDRGAEHARVITAFYEAFNRRDAEGMVACYHPEVRFNDPVFPGLDAREARGMWRMLCERAKDLEVKSSGIVADAWAGSARWDAWYTFTQTGRTVHNQIRASFRFRDGKIVEHNDQFDFWRWSRQALGPSGLLLGWSPMLLGAVRKNARKGLEKYLRDRGE